MVGLEELNFLSPFRTALSLLGSKRRGYFWALTFSRGILTLLDLAGLLVLALAVNVLTSTVQAAGFQSQLVSEAAQLIEQLIGISKSNLVLFLAVVVLILFLLKAVLSSLLTLQTNQFLARCETTLTVDLANRFFHKVEWQGHISSESASYALTFGTSAMVSRGLGSVSSIASEIFALGGTLTVLLVFQPVTTLVALIYLGGLGALIALLIGNRVEKLGRASTYNLNQASTYVKDTIGVQRELFLAGKLDSASNKVEEVKRESSLALGRALFFSSLPRHVIEAALVIGAFGLAAFEFRMFDLMTAVTGLTVFLAGGSRLAPACLNVLSGIATLRQVTPDAEMALNLFAKLEGSNRG